MTDWISKQKEPGGLFEGLDIIVRKKTPLFFIQQGLDGRDGAELVTSWLLVMESQLFWSQGHVSSNSIFLSSCVSLECWARFLSVLFFCVFPPISSDTHAQSMTMFMTAESRHEFWDCGKHNKGRKSCHKVSQIYLPKGKISLKFILARNMEASKGRQGKNQRGMSYFWPSISFLSARDKAAIKIMSF